MTSLHLMGIYKQTLKRQWLYLFLRKGILVTEEDSEWNCLKEKTQQKNTSESQGHQRKEN